MPAHWRIDHWPACVAHAFFSHCAEDRNALVIPVYEELSRRRFAPWIDRHHYPAGRNAVGTLREELLKCRHVIYFITPAMVRQGRGWPSAERALAETIQQQLVYGDEIAHVELVLLFMTPSDPIYLRSVWRSLSDKTMHCPHRAERTILRRAVPWLDDGVRTWRQQHVRWAADTIEAFICQEERWAAELTIRFNQDSHLQKYFSRDANLAKRILALSPPSLHFPSNSTP